MAMAGGNTKIMVMAMSGSSVLLVVVAAVVLLIVFKDKIFGGGGGGEGTAPTAPKGQAYVCKAGKVWGTGPAAGKCCNANQDTSNPDNCADPTLIDRVIFYEHPYYTGTEWAEAAPSTGGKWDHDISSIHIPDKWKAEVYDKENMSDKATSKTFTSPAANLKDYGWDNRILSFRVSTTAPLA